MRRGTKFDIKDNDDDEAALALGTFEVKYLGSFAINSPGAPGVITACVKQLEVCLSSGIVMKIIVITSSCALS